MFLETLMRPRPLDPEDLDLLQRWCGLALISEILAQRIVFRIGTPGGGPTYIIGLPPFRPPNKSGIMRFVDYGRTGIFSSERAPSSALRTAYRSCGL
jgi:hypothetical protein